MGNLKLKLESTKNDADISTLDQSNLFEGRVEIHGTVELKQFYYMGGQSDADTVKITMQVNAIRFRKNDQSEWQDNLTLFKNANVGGNKVIDSQGRMKIRLQGIDAPELHFRPTAPNGLDNSQKEKFKSLNREFRQPSGPRSVFNLVEFLKSLSQGDENEKYVNVFAFSYVDSPNDLFDRYGRAVADIVLTENENNTASININQWLVENGWAFPDFYNSMSFNEIKVLQERGISARQNGNGIWKEYSQKLQPFDFELFFEKDTTINPDSDSGPMNPPKIFRRQAPFEILIKAEIEQFPNFKSYLQTLEDNCYATSDFLENRDNAELFPLSDSIDEQDHLIFSPGDLVFVEADSILKDENGNPIKEWF